MLAFKCPKCGTVMQCYDGEGTMTTELAVGSVWGHSHGNCEFYSQERNPEKIGDNYWCSLRIAWENIRENYPADDWRAGWDAFFAGRKNRARRLWERYEQTLDPEMIPTIACLPL